ALLSAVPQITKGGSLKQRIMLEGEVPSPLNPPPGCRFSTRCRLVKERCRQEEPELREVSQGHLVACHLV
ncbi:MAG: oligopeptide/dipeptide ABC transporter ATP-binding protein, partial [Bacillota bacterium]